MNKKLIINADDYGICPSVNYAVENLIKAGKLQDVSVLANFPLFENAVDFLLRHPDCSVGIHLNVVEGSAVFAAADKLKILLGGDGRFVNLNRVLMRYARAPFAVSKAVEAEWRAQIEILLNSGLKISHADSHQHIHAFPPFWNILTKLCREYGISAARQPSEQNEIRLRRAAGFALRQAANVSRTFSPNRNLSLNNHFLGFKRVGIYGETEMVADVRNLKNGVTELCVHPSLDDGIPYPAIRGTLEYEALSGSKLWKQIVESEIELTTWAKFSNAEARKN
ncbi:MAG: ChbG/HpnK family deacetylase [Pyrinomonadaceae bacterium]|nr:ChbG/HpnK family deacetylase [Pyrinomonadaceae bacterium]